MLFTGEAERLRCSAPARHAGAKGKLGSDHPPVARRFGQESAECAGPMPGDVTWVLLTVSVELAVRFDNGRTVPWVTQGGGELNAGTARRQEPRLALWQPRSRCWHR